MKEIDVRGLACPAPVIQTKKAMEENSLNRIRVLVDNEAAKQNVQRFLASQGFDVSIREKEGVFYIAGSREDAPGPQIDGVEKADDDKQKIMVMVAGDCMGHGDDELGSKLMVSFLKTLAEMGEDLWRLVFVNNGVKLTVADAEILPVLKQYEKQGLCILVCGTCLTHFDLLEQKQVGQTTNMLDIVTAMQLADKVINI